MKDYLTEMLYALTSAYSSKDYENAKRRSPPVTNIGKLFSIFSWGLSIVDEQARKIKDWDNLDNARGKVLDRYGRNFGVDRMGSRDSFYRLAIKVKIMSQLSGGDIDTILNAAAMLFEIPVEHITLTENFPAKIGIDVIESELSEETLDIVTDIAVMLKRIVAAGVGFITTLQAYREYDGTTLVEGALFDRSNLVFDLPDVKRKESESTNVASALFDRSNLVFDLPDVRRKENGADNLTLALFDRSNLMFDLPDVKRAESGNAKTISALFRRCALTYDIPNMGSCTNGAAESRTVLFEYTHIQVSSVC